MSRRILITGGGGMLGRTLARRLGAHDCWAPGSRELDITDAAAVDRAFAAWRPEVVVHCAALTAVDRCESERDLAFRVNAGGSEQIAMASAHHRARLFAISTDYVFAGDLARPYREDDAVGPRTVYGASKLVGEEAVRRTCPDHVVLRVAWLYGPGGPSFVHTMLKLGAQAGKDLTVVDDQIGNPTSTDAVATALIALLDQPFRGTMHLTCEGEATWYGFAREIFAQRGLTRGLRPCTTAEFPRPAPRPANSRLDKTALRAQRLPAMPHWRDALHAFFKDFPDG